MEILKHNIKLIDIRPEFSILGVATKTLCDASALAFTLTAATYLTTGHPREAILDASIGIASMIGDLYTTRTAGKGIF